MSQDSETCALCGKLCGYDNGKGYWDESNKGICEQCIGNLISRFCAFFGIDPGGWEKYGMVLEWDDVDKILSNIKRDEVMRISYIVTDKTHYLRTKTTPVSVLEGI